MIACPRHPLLAIRSAPVARGALGARVMHGAAAATLALLAWTAAQAAEPVRAPAPAPAPRAAPELPRAHPADDDAHDHTDAVEVDFAAAIGAVAGRADLEAAKAAVSAGAAARRAVDAAPGVWLIQVFPSARVAPSDERGLELQGGVQRTLPLGDLRGARRAAVAAQRDALAARVDADTLSAKLVAARAWLTLWTTARISALLREELAAATASVRHFERGKASGASSAHALAEAEAWRAEIEGRAVELEHDLHHAGIELARTTALPLDRPLRAVGALPAPPLPDAATVARALRAIADTPAARLAALERDAARARAAEARVSRGSSLQLGGWVELGTPADATFRLTLGWQPPSRPQSARAAVDEAEALARHQVELARLRRDAEAALRDASHEVHHSARALAVLRAGWLPAASRRLALRRAALAAGAGRRAEALAAERQLLAARITEVQLQAAASWAAVQLWLLLERGGRRPGEESR